MVLGISHTIQTKYLKLIYERDEQDELTLRYDLIRQVLAVRPACNRTWWLSIEKNGLEITIQSGLKREDVTLNFKGERRIKTQFWDEYYPQLMESYAGLRGNTNIIQILQDDMGNKRIKKVVPSLFRQLSEVCKYNVRKIDEAKERLFH